MIALFATIGAETGVIGRGGKTPFDFPTAYMQMHQICRGGAVIIGRHTFEHFRSAGRLPSASRLIVLSRKREFRAPEAIAIVPTLAQAISHAGKGHTVIIGGPEVYEEAMPFADRLIITNVRAHTKGDAFFPAISDAEWRRTGSVQLSVGRGTPHPLEFAIFERCSPR